MAAWQAGKGGYRAGVLTAAGQTLQAVDLPGRGHGMACDSAGRQAVIFARRPGRFALVLDLRTGERRAEISAVRGRHFYGHGCFSVDGQRLYATENDYEGERGVIGVYDAADGFRRIGELPSHGVGPHELRLHPDGGTLVVANGGILTHPDVPRAKLNLTEMAPSLVFLEASSGHLLHRVAPPAALHRLSLRHLDIACDGRVAVVAQWEGDPLERPPLVGFTALGEPLRLVSAPEDGQAGMRNYCGSVAFSDDGSRLAVTAPRGGLVTLWRSDGSFLGAEELPDVCAVGAVPGGFLLASGEGHLAELRGGRLIPVDRSSRRFDNHLMPLSV
ncbi:DUF1513 domain-containing protein [Algihabitans albus]|uniref:DUF1513 domain-containing protein n=1 Tax=Algihabitans albus TaxID=2164067 RepID=UPI0013C2CA2F|nr:DUF1513 domain-containing protein [Algihabitans albus]